MRRVAFAVGLVCAALATSSATDEANYSDWSAPVNLGPPVNTAFIEQGASISRDGLSLYFQCADCPQNLGFADIYVSQRASVDAPWGTPQPLGPEVNTEFFEGAPRLSLDGHRLFFTSTRPEGFGGQDLYVSRRRDASDDFAWETAVNLGGAVNTAGDETQPDPFEDDETGMNTLYYSAGPVNSAGTDIYVSTLLPDETYGPGVPVAELNSTFIDRQPAIRRDGLEIFFASNRTGTAGGLDLWVATRATTSDLWSVPVNLGLIVNSAAVDARPALSFDGTELYFQSTRTGNFDLYTTTRSRIKGPN
jgi:hypothetical protein